MSGWRVLARNLYAIGGEARRCQFDTLPTEEGGRTAVNRAAELGLMRCMGRGVKARWQLTELGRAFCEGRADIKPQPKARTGGRAPHIVSATWLTGFPGLDKEAA